MPENEEKKCGTCGKFPCVCAKKGGGDAAPGKVVLVVGTSTAGKTTLCKAVLEKANNLGISAVVDGIDAAEDRTWKQSSTIDGTTFKSANDHFVDSMKQHINPEVVSRAAAVFEPRTLIVAVFSRKNLGNPKVDTVNLEPEGDLDAQSVRVHKSLSLENQQKYQIADIKDLLTIIKACPSTPQFMAEHPYPPLRNVNDHMLDQAIERARSGTSSFLDIVGNETIQEGPMVEHFKTKIQSAGLPPENALVVAAHCPIDVLIDRISNRNREAKDSGKLEDMRLAFFPFQQYAAIYQRVPDQVEPGKIIGTVSRTDIRTAAQKFGNGDNDANRLIQELGFQENEQSIPIVARSNCNHTLQTATMQPEEIAEKLCNQVFDKELSQTQNLTQAITQSQQSLRAAVQGLRTEGQSQPAHSSITPFQTTPLKTDLK